jgi:hypothetical protein
MRNYMQVGEKVIRERNSMSIYDPTVRQEQIIILICFHYTSLNMYENVFVIKVKRSVNQEVRFLSVLH